MSNLSYFLAGNVEKRKNKKMIISERFKDEAGKPVPWEIRSVTASEDAALRKDCTTQKQVPGKRGQYTSNFDANTYIEKLITKAVVYPDLNNTELQDSYGVKGAESLARVMLYKDEYDKLADVCTATAEIEDPNDLRDEAKN